MNRRISHCVLIQCLGALGVRCVVQNSYDSIYRGIGLMKMVGPGEMELWVFGDYDIQGPENLFAKTVDVQAGLGRH